MATKRISALTAASAAALTDQIPIEDASSATKKLTLTQAFALVANTGFTWTQAQAFGAGVTMASTLGVTGAVVLSSTLSAGASTLSSLSVGGTSALTGAVTMASTLAVTGLVTLATLPRWSALTPGSIPFGAASGQLSQDNAALFWDAANDRLGIGTATPARALDVVGTFGATGAATLGSTLAVTGASTLTGAVAMASTLAVTGAADARTVRANGTSTFTTGSGLELSFGSPALTGRVLAYDRDAGAYRDLLLAGSAVAISTGGYDRATWNAAGVLTHATAANFSSTLGVTGASTLTGGLAVWAAPTFFANRAIGARYTVATSGGAVLAEVVGNPASTASNVWNGVVGRAEIAAGNAFGTSAAVGLRGIRGNAVNAGSGTVTGAASCYLDAITNTGGGTITNAYGLYLDDQTAATNNYGVYQVGAGVINYLAGRLGIGVTSPDVTAIADLRAAGSQLHLGNATKQAWLGANTNYGAYVGRYATNDNTGWTARNTSAGIYVVSGTSHAWFLDTSGLTDGSTFAPTQRMALGSTNGGSLWVAAVPSTSYVTSTRYGIGTRPTITGLSGNASAMVGNALFDPTANTSVNGSGVYGIAESTGAFDFSSNAALVGVRANAIHAGSGAITSAAGFRAEIITNTGGGTIGTIFGVYIGAQTAATTNWGVYQLGTTTPNLFAGPLTLGSTTGPIIKSGTGSPEGVETAGVGSLFLRTNGGAGTTLYAKTTGAGNTGWSAVA